MNAEVVEALKTLKENGYVVNVSKPFFLRWRKSGVTWTVAYDYDPLCGKTFEEYQQDMIRFGQKQGGTFIGVSNAAEYATAPEIGWHP